MTSEWNDYRFRLWMRHLAPGEKLSEVELLKMFADHQWESIGRLLGRLPREILSDDGTRLYGSLLDLELDFGAGGSQDSFLENDVLHLRNRVSLYAGRFVEGLFAFGPEEIPDAAVEPAKTRADLASLGRPWACITNAFIGRMGSNEVLKTFKPAGVEGVARPPLSEPPEGLDEHRRVQASGRVAPLPGTGDGLPLPARHREPVAVPLVPESDLNGVGLLYFARYVALSNVGERIFLTRHLERPFSAGLQRCLSTEHRRIFYFANAGEWDTVHVVVSARLLPADDGTSPEPRPYRTPFRLVFRSDLYRASDGTLMASTLVRKALNVPGSNKAVLLEAERALAQLEGGSS